jgi:hypothetical protein
MTDLGYNIEGSFFCYHVASLSGRTPLPRIITALRTVILRDVASSRHSSNKFGSALDFRHVIHISPRWGDE